MTDALTPTPDAPEEGRRRWGRRRTDGWMIVAVAVAIALLAATGVLRERGRAHDHRDVRATLVRAQLAAGVAAGAPSGSGVRAPLRSAEVGQLALVAPLLARDLERANRAVRERRRGEGRSRFRAVRDAAARAADRRAEQVRAADRRADLGMMLLLIVAAGAAVALSWRLRRAHRDAAELEERELALRRREERFRAVVQHSNDIVCLLDAEAVIRYPSESTQRLLGYDPTELIGIKLTNLAHPEDAERVTYHFGRAREHRGASPALQWRMRHQDGTWLHVEAVTSNVMHQDGVNGFVVNIRDVSERRQLEHKLEHQAFHDSLTDLANRVLFEERVGHALTIRARKDPLAVLFLDLDDFKTVNDSLGHAAGDLLLVTVAERLRGCLRTEDTAARLGGDEFAVLLEQTSHLDAAAVAERIIEALSPGFTLEGRQVFLRASIGIVLSDGPRPTAAELLRNADVAMYAAKREGKGRFAFYNPTMHAAVLQRMELKADLQRAIDEDELILYYQPVADLETGDIQGAEALVRWRHPRRGLLSPDEFIPIAEADTNLIVSLGRWVLHDTCRQARAWMDAGADLVVGVNLSDRQVLQPDLAAEVKAALDAAGLPPANLMLEVNESLLLEDVEAAAVRLEEVKRLGVRIALDNFGEGNSSLGSLRLLPVDRLKIARPFVEGVGAGNGDGGTSFARALIELGKAMDLELLAEGIERPEQAQELLRLGCRYGQGFHFAAALPPMALDALLKRARAGQPWSEAAA